MTNVSASASGWDEVEAGVRAALAEAGLDQIAEQVDASQPSEESPTSARSSARGRALALLDAVQRAAATRSALEVGLVELVTQQREVEQYDFADDLGELVPRTSFDSSDLAAVTTGIVSLRQDLDA